MHFIFSKVRKNKTETDIAIFITPRIFDVETMAKSSTVKVEIDDKEEKKSIED